MSKTFDRRIGPVGTISRALVGGVMVSSAVAQSLPPSSWILGVAVMPAALLGWQWMRSRRNAEPIRATGQISHIATISTFLVLYMTPVYAPALSVTSGAALVFFGGSMLVAAGRGYRGCEVLAVSNWILHRNDQLGCVLFSPIDKAESAMQSTG